MEAVHFELIAYGDLVLSSTTFNYCKHIFLISPFSSLRTVRVDTWEAWVECLLHSSRFGSLSSINPATESIQASAARYGRERCTFGFAKARRGLSSALSQKQPAGT